MNIDTHLKHNKCKFNSEYIEIDNNEIRCIQGVQSYFTFEHQCNLPDFQNKKWTAYDCSY